MKKKDKILLGVSAGLVVVGTGVLAYTLKVRLDRIIADGEVAEDALRYLAGLGLDQVRNMPVVA